MQSPCRQASLIPQLKITARAGTQLINTTTRSLPDLPLQSNTAQPRLIRALHGHKIGADRLSQLFRDTTCGMGIGFRPIKRHTKTGAARATTDTSITHRFTHIKVASPLSAPHQVKNAIESIDRSLREKTWEAHERVHLAFLLPRQQRL